MCIKIVIFLPTSNTPITQNMDLLSPVKQFQIKKAVMINYEEL